MIPQLIESFESGNLPKGDWTHKAHLQVGLWYVMNNNLDVAIQKMRKHVCFYNESVGTPNTDTSGYHETVTIFWLKLIAHFIEERPGLDYNSLAALLVESYNAQTHIPLIYYSREHLISATARKTWVDPDILQMPF